VRCDTVRSVDCRPFSGHFSGHLHGALFFFWRFRNSDLPPEVSQLEVCDSAKGVAVMKKSRFSEERIVGILKRAEAGVAVPQFSKAP